MHELDGRPRRHPRTLARLLARTLAGALTLAVACGLAVPALALARTAASDSVAGVKLGSGRISPALAPDVDAAAGILVDGDGRVLWARNQDQQRAMASTTKLMTALLTIEHGGLDRTVSVSRAAAGVPYASGLVAGERLTVRQLLQLALVPSANDAAYALGESVSGDMPSFVQLMNARAQQLGLRHTHYENPHGLDQPGHYTSASDLSILLRTVMQLPDFRRTAALHSATLPGGVALKSTDELLGKYPGLLGGKTGTTDHAGYCFAGFAQRNGVTLVAVVLGTPSDAARFQQAANLFDWGFKNVKPRTLASAGAPAGSVRFADDPARSVPVRLGENVSIPILAAAGPVSRETSLPASVRLPLYQGQPVGEVRFVQAGQVLATATVVAADAVGSVGETVGAVPVSDYLDRTVVARASEVATVPAFDPAIPVRRRIALEPTVAAPVEAGQRLGEIVYAQGAHIVLRVPVVAASASGRPSPLEVMGISFARGWRAVFGGPMMATLQVARD